MCDILLTPDETLPRPGFPVRLGRRRQPSEPSAARAGSAMVLALMAVMVLASLGAGLAQLHTAIDRRQDFAVDRRKALYLAEAGIAEAALAVSVGKSGTIASAEVPALYGGGVYWVEADDLPDDRVVLRCTAQVESAEFVVRTMIVPNVNPVTRLGFFGSDGITIGWGATVDGYHSGRGHYESQIDPSLPVPSTGRLALVGSDSDIVLEELGHLPADDGLTLGGAGLGCDLPAPETGEATEGATRIYGRVRPGLHSRVRSGGRSLISGDITPYEAPPPLPMVSLPAPTEVLTGPVEVEATRVGLGHQVETWVQGSITVARGATWTVEGPAVIRCESLTLEERSHLVLDDADGPIHIYSEDGLDFRPGSTLSSPADEETSRGTYLFVAGTGEERDRVSMRASGRFHGALYAPNDIVRIPANLRWLGSAVARVVVLDPNSHVSFDRRLGIGGDGLPTAPRQLSWQVVPLSQEVARHLSIDPIARLAQAGVQPVPSALGAIESETELHYVDRHGQEATYRGRAAEFDPAEARRILGARWEDPRDGTTRTWATPAGAESTGAVPLVRGDLRGIRSALHDVSPHLDVATLSEDDALLEVTASVTGAALTTAAPEVRWAARRVDPADVSLTPEPIASSGRAAEIARTHADQAASALTAATLLPVPEANADAAALLAEAQAAEQSAAEAAASSEAQALVATTTLGPAQVHAAEAAQTQSDLAVQYAAVVLDRQSQLEALVL